MCEGDDMESNCTALEYLLAAFHQMHLTRFWFLPTRIYKRMKVVTACGKIDQLGLGKDNNDKELGQAG
jgi:predicted cupin superfamily sugar epimerase